MEYTPDEILIKLKKFIKVFKHFYRQVANTEITPAQTIILTPIIKNARGYSIQELAHLNNIDKAFVSRVVTELESKNIVERDKEAGSPERNYKIILSPKGQKIVAEELDKIKKISGSILAGISPDELRIFWEVLDKLTSKTLS